MRHIVYKANAESYPIAILVKGAAFIGHEIDRAYVQPLEARGINREDIIVVAAEYEKNNKVSATFIKNELSQILPGLDAVGTKHILCADANYFKVLARQRKADPHLGYCLPCGIEGYEHLDVILGINHKALIHNPANEAKLNLALETFAAVIDGTYEGLGNGIIHNAHYPDTLDKIAAFLNGLHQYPVLAADTETFGLKFMEAGIGTIGFAWSEHEGGAFCIDYKAHTKPTQNGNWGEQVAYPEARKLLREFLESYQGTLIWHNAPYDLKILIYELWMDHPKDYVGLLKGLEVVTRHFHDTKIIAYLALNSTAGNELGLKELAHSFAGNWAEDVTDIRKIERQALLQYNLVDVLSTFFVFKKYHPLMVKDQQEELYKDLMLPSLKTIIQMELVGMPMLPQKIAEARRALEKIVRGQDRVIRNSPTIANFNHRLQHDEMTKANAKLKTKQHPISKFAHVQFNPGSAIQLQKLLYEQMGLPVLDRTKKKAPATGADTLEKLINHTTAQDYINVIDALIIRSKAQKILSTFIPAFEAGWDKGDGVLWLHGNFNLGGTLSGRLSSSDPNMQNIPSGSLYGKLIKAIFGAPAGYIFGGADFASLEDRINALLTKDPNKLKVYEDGFDGHALRTYAYWPDQFPDLDPNDPASINTIKKDPVTGQEHPLRGKSKAPSFALQYLGTWLTLVKNAGFSEDEAKKIESNFHRLYGVSMQWVQDKIDQAAKDGYATAAFGLRIRTPMLARTYLGKTSTPKEAEAESRSVGNAVSGQSYGLLNNRAANAVMERVWASPFRYDILPVAMIHDAIYFLIADRIEVVEWLNQVLIEEMSWQELPEIRHDVVKLGAELDLFYPSWADGLTLPNSATREEILELCREHLQRLNQKEAA